MVITSAFAAFAYLSMMIADWTGDIGPDESLSNT